MKPGSHLQNRTESAVTEAVSEGVMLRNATIPSRRFHPSAADRFAGVTNGTERELPQSRKSQRAFQHDLIQSSAQKKS
jgi:hypothetical protein